MEKDAHNFDDEVPSKSPPSIFLSYLFILSFIHLYIYT